MKAKILKPKTLQATIQEQKTINAIMRGGLIIHENIELSKQDEYICWRAVGKKERKKLIPISELKVKGDKGDKGPAPIKGIDYTDGYTPKKGIDYFDGKPGEKGKPGKNGQDGLSAYELWKLEEGNKDKTINDFWAWLRREGEQIVMAGSVNVVPTGGTTGQVLKKKSDNNFDLEWGEGGGGSGTVTSVVAGTGIVVDSTDTANPIVSIDPNLLTSSITFYATTASSDIGGYTKLVTSIEDPDYDEPAVNVPTGSITGADQLVGELSTIAGLFVGNPGIITITTIGEIRKISGGSSNAQFYFKVFHRTSGGTETEIAVSNPTMAITNTVYGQFSSSALLNNGAFTETDRVVIKFYATKTSGVTDPEYEFSFGGTNPVRTLFPVPISVIPTTPTLQPYTLINKDQNIDVLNVYGVDAINGAITLSLNDGNTAGQTLTVKKLDRSDNSVFVTTSTQIDGEETIEISMEGESYDFYWTGSTFNLK